MKIPVDATKLLLASRTIAHPVTVVLVLLGMLCPDVFVANTFASELPFRVVKEPPFAHWLQHFAQMRSSRFASCSCLQ